MQEQTGMDERNEWKRILGWDYDPFSAQRQAAEADSRNGPMHTTRPHLHVVLKTGWRPLSERQDVIMATVSRWVSRASRRINPRLDLWQLIRVLWLARVRDRSKRRN